MVKSVTQLVDEVIAREGGYVNHPADRGGPTNWGITQIVARANGFTGDMRALPRATAADIYRRIYWLAPRLDVVAALYPTVAAEMFDTGINMGTKVAGAFLQRALNALLGTVLVQDGAVGPATIAALEDFKRARGVAGEHALVNVLDALQGERYVSIVEARATQRVFLFGWLAHRLGQA